MKNFKDFYDPENEIVKQICSNMLDKLPELFDKRSNRWEFPYMHTDEGTIGAFDDLIRNVPCETAYKLIPIAIDITLQQHEKKLFVTALSLLSELVSKSNTTEIPKSAVEKLKDLESKVNFYQIKEINTYWNYIKNWYRF